MNGSLGNLFAQIFHGAVVQSIGSAIASGIARAFGRIGQPQPPPVAPQSNNMPGRTITTQPAAIPQSRNMPGRTITTPQRPVMGSGFQGVGGIVKQIMPQSVFGKVALGAGVASGGLFGLAGALLKAKRAGEAFAEKQVEAGRSLAQFSGQIGYAYAKLDYQRTMNEFAMAKATSGTSAAAANSQRELERTQQRDKQLYQTVKNIASYYYTEISGALNQVWLNMSPGLTQLQQKLEKDQGDDKAAKELQTWNDALIKRAEHYGKPQMPPLKRS